ncbi:hypothetical protein A3K64_04425 [Candidatus Micrarchaeota archaeon RBG_16_36_9]|nr:MAG: hypothetical protein A3K64_04425 [Candidatus Micrarchaeota archaeon RBG_16_36_9]
MAPETFEIVEALEAVSERKNIVYDKTLKPDLIEYLEHWNMLTEVSGNYSYELTPSGRRVLESQRVKQFRRKHLFNFLSDLNKKMENKGGYISHDENKDGNLNLWTRIAYDRTTYDRRILDDIASDAHMKIETEGQPSEFIRKYVLKNERAQIDLISRKMECIHNRKTVIVCDPLMVTIYPSKPIYPAEKILKLMTERLAVKK